MLPGTIVPCNAQGLVLCARRVSEAPAPSELGPFEYFLPGWLRSIRPGSVRLVQEVDGFRSLVPIQDVIDHRSYLQGQFDALDLLAQVHPETAPAVSHIRHILTGE